MKPTLLLVCLVLLAPATDIDVVVPPGTPLEWDKDLHQPVPTGGRTSVPSTDDATKANPKAGPRRGAPKRGRTPNQADGNTVAGGTALSYGVSNLYQYFGVTTKDIMNHIEVKPPIPDPIREGDVATGGGSGVEWIYPPEYPTELVWIGIAGCLRAILHPELVSVPETAAYLCQVGEPTLVFAIRKKIKLKGPVGVLVEKLVTPEIKVMPPVPAGGNNFESMVMRLAVFELTSGFPHALDPTYARHTLALGDESYGAVLKCTKVKHNFLSRNAVAVLSNYDRPEVAKELRRRLGDPDAIIRYRALAGIGRKRDRNSVPILIKGLASPDEVWRASCAYTLGMIQDPRALKPLMQVGNRADQDYLWSIIPAVARMKGNEQARSKFFLGIERRLKGEDPVEPAPPPEKSLIPPEPEPLGTRLKLMIEMCRLGLAGCGNAEAVQELNEKFDRDNVDGFYVPNQILLCNMLARVKNGRVALKKIVETAESDRVAAQALNDLQDLIAETKWLQEQASGHEKSGIKAMALTELAGRGDQFLRPVAQKIIDGYGGGQDGGQAFVVATALQLLGKTAKGNNLDSVISVVSSAHSAGAWARREGRNDFDITTAKIRIMPPLLEIACIELGRIGDRKGFPVLLEVLNGSAGSGRGEAALALAGVGGTDSYVPLINALNDPKDGWVRFCAYQALKDLSGKDYFCDWIFGGTSSRRSNITRYRNALGVSAK